MLPLFRIGEHGIGFSDFLKALLGLLISRVFVRVILLSKLPIGALNLFDRGVARNT
jgi:hypothetical protein